MAKQVIEGKWFQFQLSGVAVPGMTDEQIRQTLIASVSFASSIAPNVRDIAVEVTDDEPANVKRRRMVIQ